LKAEFRSLCIVAASKVVEEIDAPSITHRMEVDASDEPSTGDDNDEEDEFEGGDDESDS
jgi:hypothetical protein